MDGIFFTIPVVEMIQPSSLSYDITKTPQL